MFITSCFAAITLVIVLTQFLWRQRHVIKYTLDVRQRSDYTKLAKSVQTGNLESVLMQILKQGFYWRRSIITQGTNRCDVTRSVLCCNVWFVGMVGQPRFSGCWILALFIMESVFLERL